MEFSKREFLKLGLSSAALWVAGAGKLPATEEEKPKKKIPIGLQLYSVREDCQKDLPRVLEAVAEMGYKGVEFAGYYGRTAEQLRKLLDKNGLVCCGTHTGLDTLMKDQFKRTVAFHQTLGNKYLIVPWMPHEKLGSAAAIKATAALFDKLAAKAKEYKMRVGYHAHGGDFQKIDGETAWDLLFGQTGPDVVMQLDIGNCIGGGGDPYAILKKFPGRSATIHLKEHGGPAGAAVGQGTVKWEEVFRLCEAPGGTEWYIVEQESYDASPLECVKKCLVNLKKMGKG